MGMFSDVRGPLLKGSKLVRLTDKFQRLVERRAKRKVEAAVARRADQDVSARVWERDKGFCRAYGTRVRPFHASINPLIVGHVHHIRFRSQGGATTTPNLVLISAMAHERAHARYGRIVLDIYGNADETLRFIERDIETGQVIKSWESPRP